MDKNKMIEFLSSLQPKEEYPKEIWMNGRMIDQLVDSCRGLTRDLREGISLYEFSGFKLMQDDLLPDGYAETDIERRKRIREFGGDTDQDRCVMPTFSLGRVEYHPLHYRPELFASYRRKGDNPIITDPSS